MVRGAGLLVVSSIHASAVGAASVPSSSESQVGGAGSTKDSADTGSPQPLRTSARGT